MRAGLIQLLREYFLGTLSEERKKALQAWLDEKEENRLFFERFNSSKTFRQRYARWSSINTKAAIRVFDQRTGKYRQAGLKRLQWVGVVAASLILALGMSFFLLRLRESPVEMAANDIVPGSAKAVLVLPGGEKVDLVARDSLDMHLGSGVRLTNHQSRLVYDAEEKAGEIQYNELRVPRGGEYDIELADGTKISLNSSSSLIYPEMFAGDERVVSLSGEAYFEVAKSEKPFWVKVGNLALKVYGTSFNINTHVEGKIRTVLVEGKVGISVAGQKECILMPSQLAEFDVDKGTIEVRDVDVFPYIAWTRGEFVFEGERLETIMETLSLWYDMEVFYANERMKDLHFTGIVKRYEDVDVILNVLEKTVSVHFNRKGKVLIIN